MGERDKGGNRATMDLNLLRVFDAVFEDRNLLRAGKRLHLSQSAISHALARLRDATNDQLFVRTARGMEPTAHALAIAAPLREALQRIDDAVGVRPFEPSTEHRQFVIAANDYVTSLLVTRLSRAIDATSPSIDIVVRPSTRLDLAEQIDVGRIDLGVGIFAQMPERFSSLGLWKQREVLVTRPGHPVSRRTPVLRDLVDYPLVVITVGGQEEGAVDGFIVERGLARQSEMFDRHALRDALSDIGATPRLRVAVPHALAVPGLLRDTDMMSIVPMPLAREFARSGEVVWKELPYDPPSVTVRMLWHRRYDEDPAHTWLRRQIVAVLPPESEEYGDEASPTPG
jgi:DNA-binding transcriptional LysR family regulator